MAEGHLGVECLSITSQKIRSENWLIELNPSGDKMAVIFSQARVKNHPYQLNRAITDLYTQILMILDVGTRSLENGEISAIQVETNLFKEYYSGKMVKGIRFSKNDAIICLIFDDEITSLKINGKRIEPSRRIHLASVSLNSVYCGFYNKFFVFSHDLKSESETKSLIATEYVQEIEIIK